MTLAKQHGNHLISSSGLIGIPLPNRRAVIGHNYWHYFSFLEMTPGMQMGGSEPVAGLRARLAAFGTQANRRDKRRSGCHVALVRNSFN